MAPAVVVQFGGQEVFLAELAGDFLLPIFLRRNLAQPLFHGLGQAGHAGQFAFFNNAQVELKVFQFGFGVHFVGLVFCLGEAEFVPADEEANFVCRRHGCLGFEVLDEFDLLSSKKH